MVGKSHVIFGIGTYWMTGLVINEHTIAQDAAYWLLFTPLAVLGALFPDLDHHNSRIKRNFIVWILSIPLTLFGHRTWSHSLLIVITMSSLLLVLPEYLHQAWLAFLVGYASHILGDWMTPHGVPLFYPIKTKFRSPLNFHTGSWIEYPIALLPAVIVCFFVYSNFDSFLQ